jgi:hypothetical protein
MDGRSMVSKRGGTLRETKEEGDFLVTHENKS